MEKLLKHIVLTWAKGVLSCHHIFGNLTLMHQLSIGLHKYMLTFLHTCILRNILFASSAHLMFFTPFFELKGPYSVKLLYTFIRSLIPLLSLQDFLFYILKEDINNASYTIHHECRLKAAQELYPTLWEREPLLTEKHGNSKTSISKSLYFFHWWSGYDTHFYQKCLSPRI